MAIKNLIQNGDFSTFGTNNWSNWVASGAFATGGANEAAPTVTAGDTSGTLKYSGLEGLNEGQKVTYDMEEGRNGKMAASNLQPS